MKRLNGEGTLRKRKNGTWEMIITIGYDKATGKQLRKSIYGRSQKEIQIKLEALQVELNQKTCDIAGMTVAEWLDQWMENFLPDVKGGTLVSYECICRNHLKPNLGNILLNDLKRSDIQKFYNGLRTKDLSPKYIKNIHGCLHRALDCCSSNSMQLGSSQ